MRSGESRKVGMIGAALALAVVLAIALSGVASAVPAGPRLAFLEVQYPPERESGSIKDEAQKLTIRFASVDADGHGRKTLFATPGVIPGSLGTLSWSADGEEVAFLGSAKKKGARLEAFVADADGDHLRPVPAASGGLNMVLSPDGKWIAFERTRERFHHAPKPKKGQELTEEQFEERLVGPRLVYSSTSTWIAPVGGGKARQVTRWKNWRSTVPSSWSPDGSRLLVTTTIRFRTEAVDSVDIATGRVTPVEPDAGEAAFSPDGSKIAFTSYRDGESVAGMDGPEGTRELYVANADGSGATRVTKTSEDESSPSWDPSGNRLGYLRTPGGDLQFLGIEGEAMEINADGSCPTVIALPKPKAKGWTASVQAPVWRPGEGRGVEPLSC